MSAEEPGAPTAGPARSLHLVPVTGLPDFRPGDDLAAALADAAPWIVDDDVLIVTSKVLSKVEGRLVPSPTDPDERDEFRRRLIDEQTVRLVAQMGRTKIVENRLGIVAAAAGIDASNVHTDEIALLPEDPDASARALVAAFARRGRRVGVVVTDTQGRAWRSGVTDVAIGAAGVTVLEDHRGGVDGYGNELTVTQVALGDELAAAGDLVKGKLGGVPVAVLRWSVSSRPADTIPASPAEPDGADRDQTARVLLRPTDQDLFRLGTDLAIGQGRREAVLLRRTVREFSDAPVDPSALTRAVGVALTAPAPHHTRPVRFVWVREHRAALFEAMQAEWEADLAGDGWTADRIARRTARGQVLRGAPDVHHRRGSARLPRRTAPERGTDHVHRGRRRRRAGVAGGAGGRGTGFGLDLLDDLLPRRGPGGARPARRLGAARRHRRRPSDSATDPPPAGRRRPDAAMTLVLR